MSKQAKGGIARAEKLSTDERRNIAKKAAEARWLKLRLQNSIPVADTAGKLRIGEVELDVYVLQDRRRVISKKAMAQALQLKSEGGNAFLRTLSRKGIASVISDDLRKKIEKPIFFQGIRGESCDGYEAETLIEVCDAIIEAKNKDKLSGSQMFLAFQAEIIFRSAAKIGIIALVDEATGYLDSIKDEYRKLFERFVKNELSEWEAHFPNKFFSMIYRLYGLKRQAPDTTKHPQFFGHFIRKFVYFPLANSNGAILSELEKRNPVVYAGGGRKYKFFQYLSDEIGVDAFKQHLWQVVGIGESSPDKASFERSFYRAFPEAIPKKDLEQLDFYAILEKR